MLSERVSENCDRTVTAEPQRLSTKYQKTERSFVKTAVDYSDVTNVVRYTSITCQKTAKNEWV